MRHARKSRRFGRTTAHRQAMFRNMVTSLFIHERILTTVEKAKELRRIAEKLITLGKRGDLAARRLAARRLQVTSRREGQVRVHEHQALDKLFTTLAPRYQSRPGGYTRIIKAGPRLGDGASMAFIELLPEESKPRSKKKSSTTKGKGTTKGKSKTSSKATTSKAKAKSASKD